jgi:hypothetical protein
MATKAANKAKAKIKSKKGKPGKTKATANPVQDLMEGISPGSRRAGK